MEKKPEKRRQFLNHSLTLLLGTAGLTASRSDAATIKTEQQVILTLTGAIDRTNRPKMDGVTDQLMHKHGIQFERAWSFSLADLEKLPAVTVSPTMEYDAKAHQLRGPRLLDVLNVAGISKGSPSRLRLHGIDGYSPEISYEVAQRNNFVVATHLDGALLAVGGFGPLFAIFDADRIPEMAQEPLTQRFADCPWGLYCIEVV